MRTRKLMAMAVLLGAGCSRNEPDRATVLKGRFETKPSIVPPTETSPLRWEQTRIDLEYTNVSIRVRRSYSGGYACEETVTGAIRWLDDNTFELPASIRGTGTVYFDGEPPKTHLGCAVDLPAGNWKVVESGKYGKGIELSPVDEKTGHKLIVFTTGGDDDPNWWSEAANRH